MRIPRTCLFCHAQFLTTPSRIPRGEGKYCSKRCADEGIVQRNLASLLVRFWSRVTKTDTCWLWNGEKKNGYGTIMVARRQRYAHRVAYELTYGPILPGLECCHHCDVHACVRPDHLFVGTHGDNVRDMVAKGRHRNLWTRHKGTP